MNITLFVVAYLSTVSGKEFIFFMGINSIGCGTKMSRTETGITFNGIPIEFLTIDDLLYFANFMNINLDCDHNDKESIIAIIDNAFLRIKDRNVTDPYITFSRYTIRNWTAGAFEDESDHSIEEKSSSSKSLLYYSY